MRGGLLDVMDWPWGRLSERTRASCSEPSSANDASQSRFALSGSRAYGAAGEAERVQRSWSMVIGSERIRRPVAWYTALAMAADTPTIPISPRPLLPIGLNLSGSP